MASIEFTNMREVIAGVTRSLKAIQDAQKKAATQMGITAKQVIQNQTPHPMHVLSSHWQKSIGYQVTQISDLETELVVGSNGAERYYFVQEALNHPIEIGFHKAKPDLDEIYQKVITQGLLGKSITGRVSEFNEFDSMAGL